MLRIGITGGIGSGKTTVCRIFEKLGVPVYYSDREAEILINTDPSIKRQLQKYFGKEIYSNRGLDKPKMRKAVFGNKEALKQLNAVVHPLVIQHFDNWAQQHHTAPYVIKEAALLFESGSHKQLDAVIMVSAPKVQRIQRILKRDKRKLAEIEKIISGQWPESKKRKLSQYQISNSNKDLITPQILELDHHLRKVKK